MGLMPSVDACQPLPQITDAWQRLIIFFVFLLSEVG